MKIDSLTRVTAIVTLTNPEGTEDFVCRYKPDGKWYFRKYSHTRGRHAIKMTKEEKKDLVEYTKQVVL